MVYQQKENGHRRQIVLAFLLLVLLLAGCRSKTELPSYSGDDGAAFTFIDDMGREVTMNKPERIVSLAPSSTEILFALGLGDKVVGVDDFSDYPSEVTLIDKVGAYDNPSLEKIVALKPDLVLADSIHKTAVTKLEELGIPVAVAFPRDLEGVLTSIRWIGIAAGARDQGVELEADLARRIRLVDEQVAQIPEEERPWVYYELFSEPIMTAGPNTLSSELIVRAGGRNIAYDAVTDYPEFSSEAILSRNPDVIIFSEVQGMESVQEKSILARPGWDTVNAIQNGRLYSMGDIIARPGPRVVEALEQLFELFHCHKDHTSMTS
ncbi:MAG: ABC transporter substrate-binding protein [bacterium]|jgi:iron complex transport system substrate-binding protein